MGRYNTPEVDLHALNSSFPKAAKVRSMFGDELPLDMLVRAEL